MERLELVKKLELVGAALGDLTPIMKCFMFTGDKVVANNGTMAIQAECSTDAAFAVDGKILLSLLTNSLGSEVELKVEGSDLVIKCGRSTFKLPWFSEDEFIFELPKEKKIDGYVLSEEVVSGLNACLMTVANDDSQRALMGVCFDGPAHALYSFDGDALTRFVMNEEWKGKKVCTVPARFCETVLKIIGDSQPEGVIQFTDNWAIATVGNSYTVYIQLIELKEPIDYEDDIRLAMKKHPVFVPIPEGLDAALAQAQVVGAAESRPTELTTEKGRLLLHTESHLGVVRGSLAFGKHPPIGIHVSAAVVQRSIRLCAEMALLEDVTVYRNGDQLLQVLGNMG